MNLLNGDVVDLCFGCAEPLKNANREFFRGFGQRGLFNDFANFDKSAAVMGAVIVMLITGVLMRILVIMSMVVRMFVFFRHSCRNDNCVILLYCDDNLLFVYRF